MATVISSNLYPPIIASYQNAFVSEPNSSLKIPFSYSPYQSNINLSNLKAQVKITNLNGYNSPLAGGSEYCYGGIYCFLPLNLDETTGENYIELPSVIVKQLLPDAFYKLQMRFDANGYTSASNAKKKGAIDSTLQGNLVKQYLQTTAIKEKFSEWSSVCLLKSIYKPGIELDLWDKDSSRLGADKLFNTPMGLLDITGKMIKEATIIAGKPDHEPLASYYITWQATSEYNEEETINAATSEIHYDNTINCTYDMSQAAIVENLPTNKTLYFFINYTTKNGYSSHSSGYGVKISEFSGLTGYNYYITPTVDNETGIVTLTVTLWGNEEVENQGPQGFGNGVIEDKIGGIFFIKRSSNLDHFSNWQMLQQVPIYQNGDFIYTWDGVTQKDNSNVYTFQIQDHTAGSLNWYKYNVQYRNPEGLYGTIEDDETTSTVIDGITVVSSETLVRPELYDAFISRGKQTLRLQYDYTVSSIKPTVNRTKIDTLGSKYPKFAENALLNYKQFSISGIITGMTDPDSIFLNRKEYMDNFRAQFFNKQYLPSEKPNLKIEAGYYDYYPRNEKGYGPSGEMKFRFQIADKCYLVLPEENNIDETIKVPVTMDTYNRDDFYWNREFREAVVEWLNDGEPKLYRSAAEGNMIVMLTDVSITPNQQLGRRICTFSATMYEIEDANSLETLDSLGIYTVNKIIDYNLDIIKPEQTYYVKHGPIPVQIYQEKLSGLNDILSLLKPSNITSDDFYFTDVRIWLNTNINNKYRPKPKSDKDDFYIGYPLDYETANYVEIQDNNGLITNIDSSGTDNGTIYVNESGQYYFPDNVQLVSLGIGKDIGDIIVTAQGFMTYYTKTTVNLSTAIEAPEEVEFVGQYEEVFEVSNNKDYIFNQLKQQHAGITNTSVGNMSISTEVSLAPYIHGALFNLEPGTVIDIWYNDIAEPQRYQVNEAGVLNLWDDFYINDIQFIGKRMYQVDEKYSLRENEYVVVNDNTTINNPKYNHVYNNNKIYYLDSNWYDFDIETRIMSKPINGNFLYRGILLYKIYDTEYLTSSTETQETSNSTGTTETQETSNPTENQETEGE